MRVNSVIIALVVVVAASAAPRLEAGQLWPEMRPGNNCCPDVWLLECSSPPDAVPQTGGETPGPVPAPTEAAPEPLGSAPWAALTATEIIESAGEAGTLGDGYSDVIAMFADPVAGTSGSSGSMLSGGPSPLLDLQGRFGLSPAGGGFAGSIGGGGYSSLSAPPNDEPPLDDRDDLQAAPEPGSGFLLAGLLLLLARFRRRFLS
jgi:hypothetical protein